MSETESYLFGGEEVALVVRRHPIVLAKPGVAPLAAIALVAAVPNNFTVGALIVVLLRFGWDFGLWWVDRYVLTSNRIISTDGIITKKVVSMPLAKITDLTYTKSVLGRVFGYGKLHLESAGLVGLDNIDHLPDPDRFYRAIMALALGPPSGKAPKPDEEPASPKGNPVDAPEPPMSNTSAQDEQQLPQIRTSDD